MEVEGMATMTFKTMIVTTPEIAFVRVKFNKFWTLLHGGGGATIFWTLIFYLSENNFAYTIVMTFVTYVMGVWHTKL